jgi:hypothetical protein
MKLIQKRHSEQLPLHILRILRSCDRASLTSFFIIKQTRCTNFTNIFWHETLRVSDSSSVHHQEFIHCTLSNGICHTGLQTAFEQDQDGTTFNPSPVHVEFHAKINL